MTIRIGTLVYGASSVQSIKALAPHRFESYSLTFWQTTGNTDLAKTAAELRDVMAVQHAVISSLSVFGNSLTDPETRASWERLIDHAHLFGTDLVSGFTGRIPNTPLEDSLPEYAKVFAELANRAANNGVRLCFENCAMGGTWESGDWNIAINPDAWELMWDALPAVNLGLEWEPCHQLLMLIDPLPQLESWMDKIFHVHGKDANVYWDVICKHGIGGKFKIADQRTPSFGDTDWTHIFRLLEQHGYTGTLDIEGFHDPIYCDEREIEGQVKALEYLKKCRGDKL